jgi:hypothetical protein
MPSPSPSPLPSPPVAIAFPSAQVGSYRLFDPFTGEQWLIAAASAGFSVQAYAWDGSLETNAQGFAFAAQNVNVPSGIAAPVEFTALSNYYLSTGMY